LLNVENAKKAPLSEKQYTEGENEASLLEEKSVVKASESTATGDEKITIMKHQLLEEEDRRNDMFWVGADISIRNVSETTVATAIFEVTFYDKEGNILDRVIHKEIDFKPNTSRGVLINSTAVREAGTVKSYYIKIIKTTTVDIEKVKIYRNDIRTTSVGEEVRGIVKNISDVKTDAALVASFYDPERENIGTKIIILRDIEPNSIKQFYFIFKPQEDDIVSTYTLNIICDLEE
jgi:hypothetical protein